MAITREYARSIDDDLLAPRRYCDRLVEIRLDPPKIADGAAAYYDNATGELGVRCDNPLAHRDITQDRWTTCPPLEWNRGPCAHRPTNVGVGIAAACNTCSGLTSSRSPIDSHHPQ